MSTDDNKFNKSDSIDVLNAKIKVRSSEFRTTIDVVRTYEYETGAYLSSANMIVVRSSDDGFEFHII